MKCCFTTIKERFDSFHTFKISMLSLERPTSVKCRAGGSDVLCDFNYTEGSGEFGTENKIDVEFMKEFTSKNNDNETFYSAGDKIPVELIIEYKTKNEDGSTRYEELILKKTSLKLVE